MDARNQQQQQQQQPQQQQQRAPRRGGATPSGGIAAETDALTSTADSNGNGDAKGNDATPDSRMQAAMAFLRREFRRRPDLSEIAKAAHLSRYHFHRSFRKTFGKTPKQVLDELQIAEVQRLILTGVTLMQAARQVGFTQQSHLTARFKKATGVTPKAWLLLARAKAGQGGTTRHDAQA